MCDPILLVNLYTYNVSLNVALQLTMTGFDLWTVILDVARKGFPHHISAEKLQLNTPCIAYNQELHKEDAKPADSSKAVVSLNHIQNPRTKAKKTAASSSHPPPLHIPDLPPLSSGSIVVVSHLNEEKSNESKQFHQHQQKQNQKQLRRGTARVTKPKSAAMRTASKKKKTAPKKMSPFTSSRSDDKIMDEAVVRVQIARYEIERNHLIERCHCVTFFVVKWIQSSLTCLSETQCVYFFPFIDTVRHCLNVLPTDAISWTEFSAHLHTATSSCLKNEYLHNVKLQAAKLAVFWKTYAERSNLSSELKLKCFFTSCWVVVDLISMLFTTLEKFRGVTQTLDELFCKHDMPLRDVRANLAWRIPNTSKIEAAHELLNKEIYNGYTNLNGLLKMSNFIMALEFSFSNLFSDRNEVKRRKGHLTPLPELNPLDITITVQSPDPSKFIVYQWQMFAGYAELKIEDIFYRNVGNMCSRKIECLMSHILPRDLIIEENPLVNNHAARPHIITTIEEEDECDVCVKKIYNTAGGPHTITPHPSKVENARATIWGLKDARCTVCEEEIDMIQTNSNHVAELNKYNAFTFSSYRAIPTYITPCCQREHFMCICLVRCDILVCQSPEQCRNSTFKLKKPAAFIKTQRNLRIEAVRKIYTSGQRFLQTSRALSVDDIISPTCGYPRESPDKTALIHSTYTSTPPIQ